MPESNHIEELFAAALALPREERSAFLHEACAGREVVRAEVQDLLDHAESQDGFLEGSPLGALQAPAAELDAGTMLGRFRILEHVGRGGMGDVYKANDTRLGRVVALKICRERFTERFEREARAIASLSHPHICTLYDVGANYLVMEFIEGRPLQGPLRVETALQYAIQAADALWAAHRQGVVHRDFKPGNVMVAKSGVKLVDFGLAKTVEAAKQEAGEAITQAHQMPGTLRYMAPEQLESKQADARSDLFAFGLVLHEAITGTPVFAGSSQAGLISAILRDEPPPLVSPHGQVPAALERVVRKCLAKDPEERWQTAADLRDELRWIAQSQPEPSSAATMAPARKSRRRWVGNGLAAAALVALGFAWRQWPAGIDLAPSIPVVVLMDTPAPPGVYDPETRLRAGTNADDLNDALRSLPVSLHKETVGATWNREDQVANQQPSLILVHRSVFVHALVYEFKTEAGSAAHKGQWPDPDADVAFYGRLSRIGRDRLEGMLGYFAAASGRTRFIVYAREWSEGSRAKWSDALVQRFPGLRGRVEVFEVQPVDGVASFRKDVNVARMREVVSQALARR